MRFAVLASPDSWYARDLQRAAADRHDVVILPFSEMHSRLEGSRIAIECGGHDLTTFQAILVRTMPPGSLEQVVFRMDLLARCEASGVSVINPSRAVEAAVDKYLASAKLHAAGLATPKTETCQTVEDAMAAFERFGGDVVVKPLFGSEGRGITRVSDIDLAFRAFKMLVQYGAVIYLQEFIPHEGFDLRLFVVGRQVWGMKRRNEMDWRTNVSRGATTEPMVVTDELAKLALRASDAIGTLVAGVDVLPARSGELFVIEVNAVPGWKALAKTLEYDIARHILEFVSRHRSE